MKNANWTRILTILLSLLALYALFAVAASVIQRFIVPVLLVMLAAILAFILTPVVDFIQNRLHVYRGMAILTTYLLVAAVFVGLGFYLTSPLITQTKSLADAIKNPTHLSNVIRVKVTASRLHAEADLYASDMGSRNICQGSQYVDEFKVISQGNPGCLTDGQPPPRPPKTLPELLYPLRTRWIPALRESSVRPTSKKVVHRRGRQALVPRTQVPSRYRKWLEADVGPFAAAIRIAKAHLQAGRGDTYYPDAKRIRAAAAKLDRDAKNMYHIVKSSPIILLALQNRIDGYHLPIDLHSLFGRAVGKITGQGSTVLNNAVTILTSTIAVIFDLFIIIIMSIYLLADGPRFIGWLLGLLPEGRRDQAWFFLKSLDRVLGGYLRGQIIVAITIGVLAGAGSYALGVPYALLIGIFAFLAESIPVIGPVLASVPAILVSLFTQPVPKTLLVVAWFIVIQQIEQNVVGPRITGHAVGIHPVVAMVAIIIGLEVGGFWGAFLAVPVTGMLQVVIREGYNVLVLRRPMPKAPVPETVEIVEEHVVVSRQ